MSQNLTLEVVTPEKVLLETTADYVTVPGSIGELGILAGHIPLLTSLKSGVLSYKSDGAEKKFAVHFGYAEVCQDKITVLATQAEASEDINLENAKANQQKAEQELADLMKGASDIDKIEERQHSIQIAVTQQEAVKQYQSKLEKI